MEERATERLRKFASWAQSQGFVKGEASFEKTCGLSTRYIANNINPKRAGDMTTSTISRVYKKFPMLNLVWLCTGEGEMINPIQNTMLDYKLAYDGAIQQISALNNIINTLTSCDTKMNPNS